ncbi:MAG: BACON domain-containing carbohydrate-binding protein [Bacteroidota bacterium]|nr:BACON domain-containing carbohydrate-binding protein [Bacteroidota bacterium]
MTKLLYKKSLLCLSLISIVCSAQTLTIDASNSGKRQVIDGFGTCLYGTPGEQTWFQNLYYDDAKCSILRFDITPTFRSPYSDYTYNSPWFHNNPSLPGPENNNVRTYTGASDYTRLFAGRNAQIAVMGPNIDNNVLLFDYNFEAPRVASAMAVAGENRKSQLGDFKLIGSMWSPAPWLKISSGNVNTGNSWPLPVNSPPYPFIWNGNFVGGKLDVSNTPLAIFNDGIQNTSALTQYARSTAAYLRGFQNRNNVKFYAISIQNELNFETFYHSSFYPLSSQYIAAAVAVRRELDKYADLKHIKIMGPEDLLSGADYALWQYGGGSTTVHKNLQYLQNIGADTAASRAVDFFCIHGYAADGVSSAGANPLSWERWANGWTSSPGGAIPNTVKGFNFYNKKSWMTETSGEDPAWLSPSSGFPNNGGFSVALNIHQALTTGNESGYVYWQMADGGSNSSGATLSGSSDQATASKYNAFKHFSRFIRPNSVRLSSTITGSNVLASAYVNNIGNDLTIVLINSNNSTQNVTVNVPTSVINGQSFNAYTSRNGSMWASSVVTNVGNTLTLSMQAYSVVTLNAYNPNIATLSVSPTILNFTSTGSSRTLTVASNINWTVTENASWLSTSVITGTGNGTILVTASNSTLTGIRVAQITVSGSGINNFINVTQTGITPNLSFSQANISYTSAGGTTAGNISSNISWTVFKNATWLSLNVSSGTGSGGLSITALANTSTGTRFGVITLSGGGITQLINVTQTGVTPNLSFNQANISYTSAGGTTAGNISSNISWTLFKNATWLSLNVSSGTGSGGLSITALANTSTGTRLATITLTGGGLTQFINVTQTGANANLTVSPSALSYLTTGSTTIVSITSNINWSVSNNTSWISLNTLSGFGNKLINVTASNYTVVGIRTGMVTISGNSINCIVSVTQTGVSESLSIGNNNVSVTGEGGIQNIQINSNSSWSIIGIPIWLSIQPQSGVGNANPILTVNSNNTSSDRTVILTISGLNINQILTVNQGIIISIPGNNTNPGVNTTPGVSSISGNNNGPDTTLGINTLGGINHINKSEDSETLLISPNPVLRASTVYFNKLISFSLFDIYGNLIASYYLVDNFQLGTLASGIYLIKTSENEIRRLLVE